MLSAFQLKTYSLVNVMIIITVMVFTVNMMNADQVLTIVIEKTDFVIIRMGLIHVIAQVVMKLMVIPVLILMNVMMSLSAMTMTYAQILLAHLIAYRDIPQVHISVI